MADIARPRVIEEAQSIAQPFEIAIDSQQFARKVTVFNLTIAANQVGTGYLDVFVRMAQTDIYVALLSSIDGTAVAFDLSAPDVLVVEDIDIGAFRLVPRAVVGITSVYYCLGGIHDE